MKKVLVMTAAAAILLAGCGSSASSGGTVTENSDGSYTAEESADVAVVEQNLSYTIKLKVTADADGTIQSVEDNGTEIPDGKDGAYKQAEALFTELAGKNKDTISDVDAVSGATLSSEAILSAAKQALEDIGQKA